MKDCPGTDALATVASALDWDVEGGVRHLSSCPDCAQRLQALQLTHEAYDESEELAPRTVDRIMNTLANAAEHERARGQRTQVFGNVIEALLAGCSAVAVVSASDLPAPTTVTALTFAVVATALFGYRVFSSRRVAAE
jgi:hypothetical protein